MRTLLAMLLMFSCAFPTGAQPTSADTGTNGGAAVTQHESISSPSTSTPVVQDLGSYTLTTNVPYISPPDSVLSNSARVGDLESTWL